MTYVNAALLVVVIVLLIRNDRHSETRIRRLRGDLAAALREFKKGRAP